MRWSRREVFGLGLSACLGGLPAGCARIEPRRDDDQPEGSAPHYFVVIHLLGGYDPLLTFYPLERATPAIDVEYRADDRLRGKRRYYGPLFAPLLPLEEELCLI